MLMIRKADMRSPDGIPPGAQLIDTKQFAAMLSLSVPEFRRMLDAGKLPKALRVGTAGTQLRWRLSDAIAYVEGL